MNEKKSNSFAALLITVVVAVAVVFGVKFAGGSAAPAETAPAVQPGESGSGQDGAGELAGAYQPGTYTASGQGFHGEVTVTVVIGDDGTIADIQVDASGETAAFADDAVGVLVPAMLKAQSADVDVVSTSTNTKNAIIEAVRSCLGEAGGGSGASSQGAGDGGSAGAYKAGSYTAAAQGFNGEVSVTVTVGDDGAIAAIDVDMGAETPAYAEDAVGALVPAMLKAQSADVDVVSTSTYTKGAIIEAVQDCLGQAAN